MGNIFKMKIAFYNPRICIRGTSNALYDYAHFNETILGNKSIIITSLEAHDKEGLSKYKSRFEIFFCKDLEAVEKVLTLEEVNVLYCIKYGKNDGFYSRRIKTVVHCVFDMSEPHGDIYAGVSKDLASKFNSTLFVPHMISLIPSYSKANLRKKLNIPENAIVFGRYGGMDTFNLNFCWNAIKKILENRKDVYFLFINTPNIYSHERIIHLPVITEDKDKNEFICTCDAYLECGTMGHSFGIAIGEFSVNNKPIIAYRDESLWNTAHISILGDKGLYYRNEEEFYNILNTFDPKVYSECDMNCYRNYNPHTVMKAFSKTFLENL